MVLSRRSMHSISSRPTPSVRLAKLFVASVGILIGLMAAGCSSPKFQVSGQVTTTLPSGEKAGIGHAAIRVYRASEMLHFLGIVGSGPVEFPEALDLVFSNDIGRFSIELKPGNYAIATKGKAKRSDPFHYWVVAFNVVKDGVNKVELTSENALPRNGPERLISWINGQISSYYDASEKSKSTQSPTSGSASSKSTISEAQRIAQTIKAEPNVTTTLEMLEQIPVLPSTLKPRSSNRRIFWVFSDMSWIVATFKPRVSQGGELEFVLNDVEIKTYEDLPSSQTIISSQSSSSSSISEARRVAFKVNANLDVTTAVDMQEQIPVAVSNRENIGSRRKITWTFSDGSKIIATFKPLGGEGSSLGLVLYAVEIRD